MPDEEGHRTGHATGGLSELLSRDRGDLLRFLTVRCGTAEEAEELLQDLWIRVSSHRSGPIANGRAYLFRTANNLVIDRRRSQRRAMARDRLWLDEEAGHAAPEQRPDGAEAADDAIIRFEEASILHAAIADLPSGARRALTLHRFQGHSQGEVARIMGISRSGVEKHLALAMRHLRKALLDCGYFDAASSLSQERDGGERSRRTKDHD